MRSSGTNVVVVGVRGAVGFRRLVLGPAVEETCPVSKRFGWKRRRFLAACGPIGDDVESGLTPLWLGPTTEGASREHYARFEVATVQALETLTRLVSIDRRVGREVWAYATDRELAAAQSAGFDFDELPHPGKNPGAAMGLDFQAKLWSSYPTYDDYVEAMTRFANQYPALCRLEDLGPTTNRTRPHRCWCW